MFFTSLEYNADTISKNSLRYSFFFSFKEELLTLPFSLVHSFIIDIEDTFIKDEFTGEEISEIVEKGNGQSRPEIDEKLFEYINTFAKVSLSWIDIISFFWTLFVN